MPINPDRLERYKSFVEPNHTEATYDPRQGLERLLGILSPDPKGIVLTAMSNDWYSSDSPLRSQIFRWLDGLGLQASIFPLGRESAWNYLQRKEAGETVDGSLVELGAVVKRAEDPFQTLFSRSVAGTELAVPLVQQAVKFVSRAQQLATTYLEQGRETHKFDSMWKVLGGVQTRYDSRRPLGIFDMVDFLVKNPGDHKVADIADQIHISKLRAAAILSSLGKCGVINYHSAMEEKIGHTGRKGWSVYTISENVNIGNLDPDIVYQNIRKINRHYFYHTALMNILDYIKQHPGDKYETGRLYKLGIYPTIISATLSLLVDLSILERPNPEFKGGHKATTASANDLSHIFYDLILEPAKDVADNLSPLPLKMWNRDEVANFLVNYNDERSQTGSEGGEHVRMQLIEILSRISGDLKASYIGDIYNEQAEKKLTNSAIKSQLKKLVQAGLIINSRHGFYKIK